MNILSINYDIRSWINNPCLLTVPYSLGTFRAIFCENLHINILATGTYLEDIEANLKSKLAFFLIQCNSITQRYIAY